MEGCFTFQWGAGRVFVFQMSVRPVMGIGFNEGVSEKKFRMGVALPPCPPPPPLWETLYRLLVFLNWVPYMQIYPLNACKLDWEENLFGFYAESLALIIKTLYNVTLI